MKKCSKCGEEKPETEFYKHRYTKDGLRIWCKSCCREYNKRYNNAGNRNAFLKGKHHITEEIYLKLLGEQGGVCAACGSSDPRSKHGVFSVDHNHACCPGHISCGKCVRGLLCFNCNAALGHVRDNPETLKSLASYLERYSPRDFS